MIDEALKAMRKPCKGCGKPVLFLKEKGAAKWQILDPVAPTYIVFRLGLAGEILCDRTTAMVSHFSTCSKANNFSKAATK